MAQIFIMMIKLGFCVAKFIHRHHTPPVFWAELGTRKGMGFVFKVVSLSVAQRRHKGQLLNNVVHVVEFSMLCGVLGWIPEQKEAITGKLLKSE